MGVAGRLSGTVSLFRAHLIFMVEFGYSWLHVIETFPGVSAVKNPPANACQCRRSEFDPLEKEMATHSSVLVWRIPVHEVK